MRFLLSGASGLIGRGLSDALTREGHQIVRLVRRETSETDAIYWRPSDRTLDPEKVEGFDIVVHLAGESIASGRWTEAKKHAIRDSRIVGTKLLAETLASLTSPPRLFLCASATGYYGSRGDTILTDDGSLGTGFLAEVVAAWEEASRPATAAGIRTVNLRIGVVLAASGGALEKMLPAFKLGVGGKLGSGKQYMSWITLDDLIAALQFVMRQDSLAGPINATAPNPVTNSQFTEALGRVLHRPAFCAVPSFALKLLFGEMAQDTVLASARVVPQRLTEAGFQFTHGDIESALQAVLKGR